MGKRLHTHYDNLKVARDASPQAIRTAYRTLCKQYHPDHHPDNPDAERIMRIVNRSYHVLSDPEQRQKHDSWILKHHPPRDGAYTGPISSPMPGGFRRPRDAISYPKYLAWLLVVAMLIAAAFYQTEQWRKAAEQRETPSTRVLPPS